MVFWKIPDHLQARITAPLGGQKEDAPAFDQTDDDGTQGRPVELFKLFIG
jgi:hypothetical protein